MQEAVRCGIRAVLLFGVPDQKDSVGSSAYDREGIVQRAARMIKERFPDLLVIADTCLCQYTDHGHCGIVVLQQTGAPPSSTTTGRWSCSCRRRSRRRKAGRISSPRPT